MGRGQQAMGTAQKAANTLGDDDPRSEGQYLLG